MYKHIITALTATATGLALMAAPVSAAEEAAPLPCVGGNLALQASAGSVLDVITADELFQGMFGPVDENGVVAEDWTSFTSLPDEDAVEAFAQGLLADVYDDPFLAERSPYRPSFPAQTRAVGVDDLLQGVLGTTTMVCVTSNGVVATAPYGAAVISPYDAAALSPYDTAAVTTSNRSQSLLDTFGVNRLVEGIFSGLTP
jgi:hypothetical protein